MAPTPTRRRFLKTSTLAAGAGLAGCLLGVPTTDRICGDRSPDPVEPTVADVRDRSLGNQPAGSEWPLERANPGKTGVTDTPGPRGDVGHFWRWAPRTEYESPVWVTVTDGRLYASSLDGDVLYALDPATATDQWRYDGLDSAGMPAVLGSSGERTVVVGAATGLHAVDAATGTRRWHRPGDTYDHDATLSGRDGVVYADGRDKLRAVDVETGEQLWTGGPNGHIGAVTPETVFVGGDGLRALDAADGTERWAKPDITPYGSVSVADGTAYVGELGRVHAVDVADGDKQWTFRGEAEDFETPTVTDTGVFAGSTTTEGGGGNIYRLDRDSGDHDWCRSLGDRDASATVVAGDTLLVAGSDVVQARAPEDGTIRWTHQEDHGWYTGLAVAGSALYASGEFGVVDAFGEV